MKVSLWRVIAVLLLVAGTGPMAAAQPPAPVQTAPPPPPPEDELVVTGTRPARDAMARWLRAESPHFIVYGDWGGETHLRERVERLEQYDGLLRAVVGLGSEPAARKFQVYLVQSQADLQRIRQFRRRQASAALAFLPGFFVAGPDGEFAIVDETADDTRRRHPGLSRRAEPSIRATERILFHEYARHALLQQRATFPAWFVDGVAHHLNTTRIRPARIDFEIQDPPRPGFEPEWHSYADILRGRVRSGLAYQLQSRLLAEFILSTEERRAAFRRFLLGGSMSDPAAAFTQAFGLEMDALARHVRAFQDRRTFSRIGNRFPAPPIEIAWLPSSADELLLDEAAMNAGIADAARQQQLLARLREVAPRYGDPYARRVLAQAEILFGDGAAGERLLEPLLAASPEDPQLLYLMGLRHLISGRADSGQRQREFRAARRWFARAQAADPDHPGALYRYAETLSIEPGFVSQQTSDVLLLAVQLAPQTSQIRSTAALMLMANGEFEVAQQLLHSTVTSFNDPNAPYVRTLLERAQARQRQSHAEVAESFRRLALTG